jgi:cysteine-rich repeat protein
MLLRQYRGGPLVRAMSAIAAVALTAAALFACDPDRVLVQSDRTLTSAASQDATTNCGNERLDLGESCDDGNTAAGDGCDPTCQFEDACGDEVVGPTEECEPPGTSTCDAQCRRVVSRCGNGILEQFEECEDGNAVGGDGCSAECLREACGNERIDSGEECEPPGTAQCGVNCRLLPRAACGNGIREAGEECEDGNQLSGDGCSQDCLVEFCGNSRVDPGESCEPPDTDTCNVRCQTIPLAARRGVCGNGVREPGEECDDGNTFDADGCTGG